MEINIQNVSMTYPSGKQALQNLSLELRSPSLIGLLGPNGAGKSTLMKLLVAALLPTSGSILVDGQPLLKTERQLKAQLGYLPQDFGLFNELTVAQFLDYMAALKGLRDSGTAVREVIRTVNLEGQARARIRSLSGGQRQRVAIARALSMEPKLLVADEPVAALDVSIQAQIINLLLDLKEHQNLTYMFITHDLSVVKYISDRVGVMYLGNMVELAEADEIFHHPIHPYTEALLNAIPTTDTVGAKELSILEGDIPSPVNPPKGCKFHTRCKYCTEICTQVVPAWEEVRPNHFVACHHKLEVKE